MTKLLCILESDTLQGSASQTLIEKVPLATEVDWCVSPSVEWLQEKIEQDPLSEGVVLLWGVPQPQGWILRLQTLNPVWTVLWVATEDLLTAKNKANAGTVSGVDLILQSASPLEWQCRLETLGRLSEQLAVSQNQDPFEESWLVYNQRHWMHRLNGELSLAKRHQSVLSCVVMEIHFLPLFTDAYGYGFVQALMQEVSRQINETKRNEDAMGRLGDREFAVLLPKIDEAGAVRFAQRLVYALQNQTFTYQGQSEELSISIGVVSVPVVIAGAVEEVDADGLIRYARHACHYAHQRDDEAVVQVFREIPVHL